LITPKEFKEIKLKIIDKMRYIKYDEYRNKDAKIDLDFERD